jgi:hypothetical protein
MKCVNFLPTHDAIYAAFLAVNVVGVFVLWSILQSSGVAVPYLDGLAFIAMLLAFPYLINAVMVFQLIRNPQTTSTTISDWGIIDRPDRWKETAVPWKSVHSIYFDKGSVYMLSYTRSVYVPFFAFSSNEDAREYYEQAQLLWREAKRKKVVAKITGADEIVALEAETVAQLQKFEEEEEAMWKQMEDEHEKQQSK